MLIKFFYIKIIFLLLSYYIIYIHSYNIHSSSNIFSSISSLFLKNNIKNFNSKHNYNSKKNDNIIGRYVLIIGGNFFIDNKNFNLAQFDFLTGSWMPSYRSELFLYDETLPYIWDIAVNSSSYHINSSYFSSTNTIVDKNLSSFSIFNQNLNQKNENLMNYYDQVYLVGLFDTAYQLSQTQLCSIAKLNSNLFPIKSSTSTSTSTSVYPSSSISPSTTSNSTRHINNFYYDPSLEYGDLVSYDKVGEGLCPRGDIAKVEIESIVIGKQGDLFVGGEFEVRVWNGRHFVYVYNLARYDSLSSSWLSLEGIGEFLYQDLDNNIINSSKINSIVYSKDEEILFIAGRFSSIQSKSVTPSLVLWSYSNGLINFPNGGAWYAPKFFNSNLDEKEMIYPGEVKVIEYDNNKKFLYISGNFTHFGSLYCPGLVLWQYRTNTTTCLFNNELSFSSISALAHDSKYLYIAGATTSSSWTNPFSNTVAAVDINKFINFLYKNSTTSSFSTLLHNSLSKSWEWLPGFQGTNGTIYDIKIGQGILNNFLFLCGNFDSSLPSSLLVWSNITNFSNINNIFNIHKIFPSISSNLPGSLSALGSNQITGTVSTLSLAFLPNNDENPSMPSTLPPSNRDWNIKDSDYTVIILLSCVAFGALLGLAFTLSFFSTQLSNNYYQHQNNIRNDPSLLPLLTSHHHQNKNKFSMIFSNEWTSPWSFGSTNTPSYSSGNPSLSSKSSSLCLATLADGGERQKATFFNCFERAMKARHLPSTFNTLRIISPNEIILSHVIGEGSFGRVWNGTWNVDSKHFTASSSSLSCPLDSSHPTTIPVAIKEFVFAQAAYLGGSLQQQSLIEEIVGEAGVMTYLNHPKILKIHGCCLTLQAIWIVTELCEMGSLRMMLSSSTSSAYHSSSLNHTNKSNSQTIPPHLYPIKLTTRMKLKLLIDIAEGMNYLHQQTPCIIHRDLKSHNIFVTYEPDSSSNQTSISTTDSYQKSKPKYNLVAKIGDWGSARAIALTGNKKSMTHGVGTSCWLSPEVIQSAHFSKASDVYAFSIIMWEVHTQKEIYDGLSAMQIIAKVVTENLRPEVPENCLWGDLMKECWASEPSDRPSFDKIYQDLIKIYEKLDENDD